MAAETRKIQKRFHEEPKDLHSSSDHNRPAKRRRQGQASVMIAKPAFEHEEGKMIQLGSRRSQMSSILTHEERLFPRGDRGALTPLEQRQIRAQATRDVLFEESRENRQTMDNDLEEDAEVTSKTKAEGVKVQKTPIKRKYMKKDVEGLAKPGIRISGLKFKNIEPGMITLGQISRISAQDLTLDLPNNLIGFVPITSISKKLNNVLESLAEGEESGSMDDQTEAGKEMDLSSLFSLGQYLRASIISTSEESTKPDSSRGRKKIELSIDPKDVNKGLSNSNIPVNCLVQASVVSVEDHGLIMDLGLHGRIPKGFMSSMEIPENVKLTDVQEGSVLLCLVTGRSSDGNVLQLSARSSKIGDTRKTRMLPDDSSVECILPGQLVEVLVSQSTHNSFSGTIMGSITATADVFHSGAYDQSTDKNTKFKMGEKIKARILFISPSAPKETVAVSLLNHILSLSASYEPNPSHPLKSDVLPIGAYVNEVTITSVESNLGLFAKMVEKGPLGFIHISRISDSRIESISADTGKYRCDTSHRARVLAFNSIDGIYILSLQRSVLEQQFLRVEDVPLGQVVKATVEKLVFDNKGRSGLIVRIAQGIGGFVREMHMADVRLQHPDRKFKSGVQVAARVLSIDAGRRQAILTLKKSLVNTELPAWTDFETIHPASQSIGTIMSLNNHGAIVRFYGDVQAFLPASEISETYIEEPAKHFQIGQAVTVRALAVDPVMKKMTVSCRASVEIDRNTREAFKKINIGDIVSGTVTEKSADDINMELDSSNLRANINISHLSDGSNSKNISIFRGIRVGQVLKELLVLEIFEKRLSVVLTNKASLIKAARGGFLLSRFDLVTIDKVVDGFVSGIITNGVFVRFAGGLTGFLPKVNMTNEMRLLPDFGLTKGKSISTRISSLNNEDNKFTLSLKRFHGAFGESSHHDSNSAPDENSQIVVNAIDGTSSFIDDYQIGKSTMARITSVKDTQLNVQLAENVQGRIDASELFNSWDEIKDRKHPLKAFRVKQIIPVKVLGIHDARNHRFLPVSHRGGKRPVFELSAKTGESSSILSLDQVRMDSWYIAFVNNISEMCLWVNLSPNCRGRIERVDVAEDVSLLNELEDHFPIGSAIHVRVTNVDIGNQRLDLSARSSLTDKPLTFENLVAGIIVTGRVTRITDRSVLVQLSGTLAGQISLTELTDDYEDANPAAFAKNDIIKVCVIEIDAPNKKIMLSSRPSKVLSSSLPVKDKSIYSVSQLKVNDIIRGFVKNVADVGLFITLGYKVTGFVRVSEMSDAFMKDWKSNYEVDQLVNGKVIAVDETSGQLQLSLKSSVLDKDYEPPITFNDLEIGQVVTGKIRKVEAFGVFIVVDNSHYVSGLCHRSEIAEEMIQDVRTVYSEGDCVKARVLKVEPEKRRISFGLKASYFADLIDEDNDLSDDEDGNGIGIPVETGHHRKEDVTREETPENLVIPMDSNENTSDVANVHTSPEKDGHSTTKINKITSLQPGGFDWNGGLDHLELIRDPESENEAVLAKRKKRKAAIVIDETGDLDKFGPKSGDDFERLLLGQPNSSELWIRYMALQLQVGDTERARQLVERALRRMNITEQEEKLNLWTAYLNLETQYGDEDSLDDVFKRAKEVNDAQEIHERLASIYIGAQKFDKAEELFQAMTKNKAFTPNTKFWENYATFLFDTMSNPEAGRNLLDRAMKSVPSFAHRDLVTRFAQLEFRCENGNAERGRTIFERLLDTYPKRWDLWDVYVDMEKHRGASDNVRQLFERMTSMAMKRKRARGVFERWLAFEETAQEGSQNMIEHVKLKESTYNAKLQSIES